jgi:hypothetical protein
VPSSHYARAARVPVARLVMFRPAAPSTTTEVQAATFGQERQPSAIACIPTLAPGPKSEESEYNPYSSTTFYRSIVDFFFFFF